MYCSEAALIFWTQAVLEEKQSTAMGWLFGVPPRFSQEPQGSALVLHSIANLGFDKFPIIDLILVQLKVLFDN